MHQAARIALHAVLIGLWGLSTAAHVANVEQRQAKIVAEGIRYSPQSTLPLFYDKDQETVLRVAIYLSTPATWSDVFLRQNQEISKFPAGYCDELHRFLS
jgi:hypothetical protein